MKIIFNENYILNDISLFITYLLIIITIIILTIIFVNKEVKKE